MDLMPLNTYYEDWINQVDLRATKIFALGGPYRVQANFDLYNLFNANNVLAMNTGYGRTWERPIQILGGRLVKVSARFHVLAGEREGAEGLRSSPSARHAVDAGRTLRPGDNLNGGVI